MATILRLSCETNKYLPGCESEMNLSFVVVVKPANSGSGDERSSIINDGLNSKTTPGKNPCARFHCNHLQVRTDLLWKALFETVKTTEHSISHRFLSQSTNDS